jgi:hypothetical protein
MNWVGQARTLSPINEKFPQAFSVVPSKYPPESGKIAGGLFVMLLRPRTQKIAIRNMFKLKVFLNFHHSIS